MASIHFGQSEITVNLVYFGPMQSGCSTNVRQLHRAQPAREKAELRRVPGSSREERSWFFDYHPADQPRITGFDLKIRVTSIPSGPAVTLPRDAMIRGVDAVVYVADARAHRGEENLAALLDLEHLLARQGLDLGAIPVVLQVNHTDAPNARPMARVVDELNPYGFPVYEAVARQGTGVLETHAAILAATMSRLRDNVAGNETALTLTGRSRADREHDEDVILRHIAEIDREASRPSPRNPTVTAEIHLRPPALKDCQPIQLVRSELRDGRIRIEAVVRRADEANRKLAFVIQAGGETEPQAPPGASTGELISRVPFPSADRDDDLPGIWYGIAGLTAGITSGILLGFLLFA